MSLHPGPSSRPQVVVRDVTHFAELKGVHLGLSPRVVVGQDLIDGFASVTGDDYWIHTDPDRAEREGLGGTIAHGLFTLSLGPRLTYSLLSFEKLGRVVNYGYERVRFPSVLRVGDSLALSLKVGDVNSVNRHTVRVHLHQEFVATDVLGPSAIDVKPYCAATQIVQATSRAGIVYA